MYSDIYSPEVLSLIEQQNKSDKIIIVDDFHLISHVQLADFLGELSKKFAHVVLIGEKDKSTDFDLTGRLLKNLQTASFNELSLEKFYAKARLKLIEKLAFLIVNDDELVIKQSISEIEKTLTLQGLDYQLDPGFIVKLTHYYCSHITDIQMTNRNVFSSIFEASIESAVKPHLRKETTGEIIMALSELAYNIHKFKMYPFATTIIETSVENYTSTYDVTLNVKRFLDISLKSGIIVDSPNTLSYEFKSKDYLAYFIAKAIVNRISDDETEEEATETINEIMKCSCFSINPTILKFIVYTTNKVKILELLLYQAKHYVNDWDDFNLGENSINFLDGVDPTNYLSNLSSKTEEIESRNSIEKEKSKNLTLDVVGVYDYDPNDLDKINNQLMRAMLQMRTIASCVVTFGHLIKAPLKKELISTLYKMPNQIFFKWASDFDDKYIDFLDFIHNNPDEALNIKEYMEKLPGEVRKVSVSLLVNLYFCVTQNAVSMSNVEKLTHDQYIGTVNNELQRLMFLEQTNRCDEFIKKAHEIFENTDNSIAKLIVKIIARHLIIWSPSLSHDQLHQLIQRYNFHDIQKALLIDKAKNK